MSPDIHRVPQRPAFDSLIPFELSPFVPPADEYYNGPWGILSITIRRASDEIPNIFVIIVESSKADQISDADDCID